MASFDPKLSSLSSRSAGAYIEDMLLELADMAAKAGDGALEASIRRSAEIATIANAARWRAAEGPELA